MRSRWFVLALVLAAACSDRDHTGPTPQPGPAPETPTGLVSTSLDGAIALTWDDNSFQHDQNRFKTYRVYSTSYDIDTGDCGTSFSLEGTTVAPEFVVGALTNGVPRCFGVTAEAVDGAESDPTDLRGDTPRPDSRNVVLYARQDRSDSSGFRFWQDFNGNGAADPSELGLIASGNATDIDFAVDRDDATGQLFLTPVRAGTTVALYGNAPVEDLTSIDIAPETGFAATAIEAKPMWGYVFEMRQGGDFPRYGAVRVTHVGRTLLILDWSYQTDPGNPELVLGRK